MATAVADRLLDEHPRERLRDVLDAVTAQTLRSPAGWLVKALGGGWDVSDLVAERRRAAERDRRRAEQTEAAAQEERVRREQSARADAWADAISGALDDEGLWTAIQRVTTTAPGLHRRSVPLTRAQLVAWAVAVYERSSRHEFDDALITALDDGTESVALAPHELPPPPAVSRAAAELSARIRICLDRVSGPAIAGASQSQPSRRDHR